MMSTLPNPMHLCLILAGVVMTLLLILIGKFFLQISNEILIQFITGSNITCGVWNYHKKLLYYFDVQLQKQNPPYHDFYFHTKILSGGKKKQYYIYQHKMFSCKLEVWQDLWSQWILKGTWWALVACLWLGWWRAAEHAVLQVLLPRFVKCLPTGLETSRSTST